MYVCLCVYRIFSILCVKIGMGRTNKSNVAEDESLALEVYKYPCLYNKSIPEHREKDRISNAWREIDEELGFEEGLDFLYFHFFV